MRYLLISAALIACAEPLAAQTPLPFSDSRWVLTGEGTKREAADGREAISIENGFAYRRDVRLLDGSIDFDVQFTPRRAFVYLNFRMMNDSEHEELYFRPHKTNLPDAVQYTPTFKGVSTWQLFHGPGATTAMPFDYGRWTHVRLVIKGTQAALFVGDMTRPAFVMPRLARDSAPGYMALRAFTPPGPGEPTRFSNVSIRPDYVPFDFSTVAVPDVTEPARIREWRISEPFAPGEEEPDSLAPYQFGPGSQVVVAEPSGLVLLNKFLDAPGPTPRVSAVARVIVRAASAGIYRLDLGFSDVATVFVNGQPMFRGDAHYSYDAPRQDGLIGYHQASVFLPLHAGENELAVVVSDSFGGWGLQARFRDTAGLTVEAR